MMPLTDLPRLLKGWNDLKVLMKPLIDLYQSDNVCEALNVQRVKIGVTEKPL